MFSKSKINEPAQKPAETKPATADTRTDSPRPETGGEYRGSATKAKPPASVLSSDLHVVGNLRTTGDIQVEGTVKGDIRAHLLTVGEQAPVEGRTTWDRADDLPSVYEIPLDLPEIADRADADSGGHERDSGEGA